MVGWAVVVLATLGLATPAAAAAADPPPVDYDAVLATLDREIPAAMEQAQTVGLTIALVDGERTVLARGYGMADAAAGRPVTADTLFHIGSSSKTLTAAAVMQLVEQGRVDLDAPLKRYVPEFSMLPRFRDSVITVRSVLDLHSGIPGDILNGAITTGRPYLGWQTWLFKQLAQQTAERPVNTAWAYSNTGYSMLQNLIENVTGVGFLEYTRTHLFGPMGMTASTFDDAAIPEGSWAKPYAVNAQGTGATERPREFFNQWSAGSAMSSATDMAAYLKTLIARGATPTGERILQPSTVAQMLTPQTDLPLDIVNTRQGLGWYLGDDTNAWMGDAASWNGDTINYHTFLRWLPELKLGVFVSVNTVGPAPIRDAVGVRALGLMVTAKTGRTAPPLEPIDRRVAHVPLRQLRRVAGRYATGGGLDLVRATRRGLLLTPAAQNPGATPVLMVPRRDGWYTPNADSPLATTSIKPAVVAGRHVLLERAPSTATGGGSPMISVAAERLPAGYRIPQAWRKRARGDLRPVDVVPRTYPGITPRAARLRIVDGVLLLQRRTAGVWATHVLVPHGPRRAYTFGLTAFQVARGAGALVRATDDRLSVLGESYRRVAG